MGLHRTNGLFDSRGKLFAFVGLISTVFLASTAFAQEPGTTREGINSNSQSTTRSLDDVFVTESGNVSASIDGLGTTQASSVIQVDKPAAGASVRRAFLIVSASPGEDLSISDITLSTDSESLTITDADYDATVTAAVNDEENGRVEITSFISSVVDPEPAGLIDVTVEEEQPFRVEGMVLAVIFDDPSVPDVGTISLVFGEQDPAGDSFSVSLAEPFDDATQQILLSLGISFGFQGDSQVNIVDVNGARLTSSAGGQDDCDVLASTGCVENGALLTVGGIGDDPANPSDPNAAPGGDPRFDDELYTLDSFINDGDTNILVETSNPSFDDNLFFAAFLISGGVAIVGEGITLAPTSDTKALGANHTVTASIQDNAGNPVEGISVNFEVTSGPNNGSMDSAQTDMQGEAEFMLSSTQPGTDVIVARFTNAVGDSFVSNDATVTWEGQAMVPQVPVPTLGTWGVIILASLMGSIGILVFAGGRGRI